MNDPILSLVDNHHLRITVSLLVSLYAAGLVGLLTHYRLYFLTLTPLTLLLTALLLLVHHTPRDKRLVLYGLLTGLIGFGVEVVGVRTGLPFGHYYYGATLGWQVGDVPLIIGLNWLVLTYTVGNILRQLPVNNLIRGFLGAGMLVGLDVLLESLASRLDFWHWPQGMVPLLNYVGWYGVSWGLLMLYYWFDFQVCNRLGWYVYIVLLCFLGLLGWLLP